MPWCLSKVAIVFAAKGDLLQSIPLADVPRHAGRRHRIPGRKRDGQPGSRLGLESGPGPTIRKGLANFSNDNDNAQGRFNLFTYRGATVIADYGHNPDAMLALVQAVEAMPATRRSVVISGAGDRRDQDIRQQTEILGHAFDEVVMFEDQCQRGRKRRRSDCPIARRLGACAAHHPAPRGVWRICSD